MDANANKYFTQRPRHEAAVNPVIAEHSKQYQRKLNIHPRQFAVELLNNTQPKRLKKHRSLEHDFWIRQIIAKETNQDQLHELRI